MRQITTMNIVAIKSLITGLKNTIAELENELAESEIVESNYKLPKYKVLTSSQTFGTDKPLTKRAVFKTIVSNEAKQKSIEEMNAIFRKDQFPKIGGFGAYDYVADETYLEGLTKYTQGKYQKLDVPAIDGRDIYVLGEWADYENREKQTEGNFPILKEIAGKLGYDIVDFEKQN